MSPTLPEGSYILSESLTYKFRDPKRGEIVIFSTRDIQKLNEGPMRGKPQLFIKRIAGIPGDVLTVKSEQLFVNDKLFEVKKDDQVLPFHPNGALVDGASVTVPEGNYFLLGDNSALSFDSRFWGLCSRQSIKGRYLFTYFHDKNHAKKQEEKRRARSAVDFDERAS